MFRLIIVGLTTCVCVSTCPSVFSICHPHSVVWLLSWQSTMFLCNHIVCVSQVQGPVLMAELACHEDDILQVQNHPLHLTLTFTLHLHYITYLADAFVQSGIQ